MKLVDVRFVKSWFNGVHNLIYPVLFLLDSIQGSIFKFLIGAVMLLLFELLILGFQLEFGRFVSLAIFIVKL